MNKYDKEIFRKGIEETFNWIVNIFLLLLIIGTVSFTVFLIMINEAPDCQDLDDCGSNVRYHQDHRP